MEGKYIAGIMAVVVSVILVGSVLFPIIESSSGGTPAWDETITTTYNEDPDLQFDKQTSDFALNMSVTIGDDVVITNGEDTVTAPYGAMFLLAADNSAVFISVADDLIFTWSDNDGKHSLTLAGDFTAVIADDKLTINDGTAHDAPLPASYLYVPSSTGGYGSFASGELNKRAADPVIAAGSFAGAVAYNSSVTFVGDKMIMSADATDTFITSAEWIKAPAAEPAVVPFDPSSITIQPLDPSVLDPIDLGGGASIMAVPTPTYTDGDWGYDLITSGANQGKAKIVSYSGTGGGSLTVPSTIGGYDVAELGKGDNNENIIPSTVTGTDLVISEGITTINRAAFKYCGFTGVTIPNTITTIDTEAFALSQISGKLVIPDSVTSIGSNAFSNSKITSFVMSNNVTSINNSAFYGCTSLTGSLVIPDNIRNIGQTAFYNCSGYKGVLVLPEGITGIGGNAFQYSGIKSMITSVSSNATMVSTAFQNLNAKEILNIGTLELTTTSYGLNADTIQDYIGADVYIAPATITEVIHHPGTGGGGSLSDYSALLEAMGLFVIIGILVAAVGLFITMRQF